MGEMLTTLTQKCWEAPHGAHYSGKFFDLWVKEVASCRSHSGATESEDLEGGEPNTHLMSRSASPCSDFANAVGFTRLCIDKVLWKNGNNR